MRVGSDATKTLNTTIMFRVAGLHIKAREKRLFSLKVEYIIIICVYSTTKCIHNYMYVQYCILCVLRARMGVTNFIFKIVVPLSLCRNNVSLFHVLSYTRVILRKVKFVTIYIVGFLVMYIKRY